MRARFVTALVAARSALLLSLIRVPQATATAPGGDRSATAATGGTFRSPLNTGPGPFMTYTDGANHLTTAQGDSIKM